MPMEIPHHLDSHLCNIRSSCKHGHGWSGFVDVVRESEGGGCSDICRYDV